MDNRYHIKDIKIVLDAPKAKYQSGDEITGKVIVSCKGDLFGSVLTIKLNCIGHIKWAELPGLKIEGQTVDLNHQYLEQTYELPEKCELCAEVCMGGGSAKHPRVFEDCVKPFLLCL